MQITVWIPQFLSNWLMPKTNDMAEKHGAAGFSCRKEWADGIISAEIEIKIAKPRITGEVR